VKNSWARRLTLIGGYLLLLLAALTFLYPFLWMCVASLTPERYLQHGQLGGSELTLANYRLVFQKIPLGRAFLNSVLVTTIVTAGVLLTGSIVGYALSLLRFKGRELLFSLILFTMMIPFQVTLIPMYVLMVQFRWVDSYLALIVPPLVSGFAIFLFRQYFKNFPYDLVEAARLEGCSELGIIFRIVWPNTVPALVTVGILTFMNVWNDVLWPIIVIRDTSRMTMPQMVALFAAGGQAEGQLGVVLAAATMLALPVVVLYLFFQKRFIRSLATSGLKG